MKLSLATVAFVSALPAVGLGSAGCALTSKGEALTIHWYTPESAKPTLTSATSAAGGMVAPSAPLLELGRVTSGINLREKIAYRDSTFEEGYYDDRRWTERPDVYVRRELERTLFEEHGLRRAVDSPAPTLEVEVMNFEEVRGPGNVHNARIRMKVLVHDDKDALLEKTITVERPVTGKDFAGVVQAMAIALDAAAEEATADVERVLRARAAPPPSQPSTSVR